MHLHRRFVVGSKDSSVDVCTSRRLDVETSASRVGLCCRPRGAVGCEHCPSFHTTTTYRPILAAQRADTAVLAADAEHRGWTEEAARHRALIARLDALLGADDTAQTG